jgi:hypothetical protein
MKRAAAEDVLPRAIGMVPLDLHYDKGSSEQTVFYLLASTQIGGQRSSKICTQ